MKQDNLWQMATSYITINSSSNKTMNPMAELPDACLCGYLVSLHVHRFYSKAFGLEGNTLFDYVHDDLAHVASALPSQFIEIFRSYLQPKLDLVSTSAPLKVLKEAFICGYLMGIHRTGRYDFALAETGYDLEIRIHGDIIRYQKQLDDSRRACTRIIKRGYDPDNNTGLRGINLDSSAAIDDSGSPVHPDNPTCRSPFDID